MNGSVDLQINGSVVDHQNGGYVDQINGSVGLSGLAKAFGYTIYWGISYEVLSIFMVKIGYLQVNALGE